MSTVSPQEPNAAVPVTESDRRVWPAPRRPDDRFAAALRGFGPVGLIAVVFIVLAGNVFIGDFAVPLGALFVMLWASRSGTPLRALGFVTPRRWPTTILFAAALGISLKVVMKTVVMPLLGADPVNQTYRHLTGNTAALPAALWTMIVAAGFGEEIVYRGFLFERMRTLVGWSTFAKILTVVASAVVFAAAHYTTQGLAGVQQALVVALVFGAIYARTGNLWVPIIAHAAFDLTALAMIYFGAEAAFAQLLFN